MHYRERFPVKSALFALFAALSPIVTSAKEPAAAVAHTLEALPLVGVDSGDTYRVDPYIAAAAQLQALGKEEALRQLGDFALRHGQDLAAHNSVWRGEPLYVLCRMLFVPREGIAFRAPYLGANNAGQTKFNALEPIELVDGIPFLTSQGTYIGSGFPESPESYLLFCITHCRWSDYHYAPRSAAEKRAALHKIIARDEQLFYKHAALRAQIASP